MALLTRRRLLIVVPLVLLLLVGVAVFLLRGHDLKARSAQITVGLPRAQVEEILGPPALVLRRSAERGTLLSWVDQLWQVDVLLDPNDRVESVDYHPSDSFYRRTVDRVLAAPW